MIVMGSKDRIIDLGEGRFYCPNCGVVRSYARKRSARYFTLYFIPLFQVENKGEFIECRVCGYLYPPEVLAPGSGPVWGEKTTQTIRTNLESGMPIHMMMRKLAGDGFHPQLAFHNVWAVMGENAKTCPQCGFTYHRSISRCSNCGSTLAPILRSNLLNKGGGATE